MRILFFSNSNIFLANGAYANRMRGLFENMTDYDVEIDILVTGGVRNIKEFWIHKKTLYPANINIHYASLPYYIRILKKRKKIDIIENLILNKQSYLQQKNKYNYLWISIGLSMETYKKVILMAQKKQIGILQEMSEFPNLMMNKGQYQKYLSDILPKIDLLFLMTKGLIEFYKDQNRKAKIFHIPMTVDFKRFNDINRSNNNKKVISYIGLMNNKKDGVDILIKAFALVSQQEPNIILRLIGPKIPVSDYQKQQELIEQYDIKKKVNYIGEINRDNVPVHLVNSDILVLARPVSVQAKFGFPTKLGEYLATKNPVVVTKVGDIPDYLVDCKNAFLAEPDSVESFAEKLLFAVKNHEQAKSVGENGFLTANKHFNASSQAEKIIDILNQNS